MKVSLNIVKQFTEVDLPVDELVSRINQQLGGVEEVIDLGAKYKDATIVQVVECEKHPNADRLSVCKVDAGRDELVQVVCGAPNVHAGMWAVWLPPDSIVPSTFDEAEPFKLGARELRGVMSHGMLASAKELALGDDHSGIVELDERDLTRGKELKSGASFAETFDLNDTIIDIENKMFTHRPDLFGQLGVAREISAIIKDAPNDSQGFNNPEWYQTIPNFEAADDLELTVFNEAPDNVARFMAVTMKDIKVASSPLWLRCALVAMGSKPINNVVDATNYVMLMTAQPVHAYDYDKLRSQKIGARMAVSGEKVTLLNDKTYELTEDDIVIADGEGPVGLAGIMGGGDSEVSAETKNIVLEVATFDMYAVRKTSMRHGVFTDALTRFNKGQSPLQNDRVMSKLMTLLGQIAGGSQASQMFDETSETTQIGKLSLSDPIRISASFINERLGLNLTTDEIAELLGRTNFMLSLAEEDETTLIVTAPFWRTDIELPEDIVEEVGRLYGFDKLPRELPRRSIKPAPKNQLRELKQQVRESLVRAGANEALTYSFVPGKLMQDVEQATDDLYKLSNALSPDLQYYRPFVLPNLLEKIRPNIKKGYEEFALFEIGKGHNKDLDLDEQGLPRETEHIDIVYTAKTPQQGAAFYRMRRMLDQLANDLGREFVYKPSADSDNAWLVDPARSALVVDKASGSVIGLIGEPKQSILKKLKAPTYTSVAMLRADSLKEALQTATEPYHSLSRYPSTERDICFKVNETVNYAEITEAVDEVLSVVDLETSVEPVDIYKSPDLDTKNITIRIKLAAHDRTLTGAETAEVAEQVIQKVINATQAVVV